MSTEDTLRQHSFVILGRLQSGTEDVVTLDVALAAVTAEREACAELVDGLSSGPYALSGREIVEAIRARQEPQG